MTLDILDLQRRVLFDRVVIRLLLRVLDPELAKLLRQVGYIKASGASSLIVVGRSKAKALLHFLSLLLVLLEVQGLNELLLLLLLLDTLLPSSHNGVQVKHLDEARLRLILVVVVVRAVLVPVRNRD